MTLASEAQALRHPAISGYVGMEGSDRAILKTFGQGSIAADDAMPGRSFCVLKPHGSVPLHYVRRPCGVATLPGIKEADYKAAQVECVTYVDVRHVVHKEH